MTFAIISQIGLSSKTPFWLWNYWQHLQSIPLSRAPRGTARYAHHHDLAIASMPLAIATGRNRLHRHCAGVWWHADRYITISLTLLSGRLLPCPAASEFSMLRRSVFFWCLARSSQYA